MVEYIKGGISRHYLTKIIKEEQKERIQIVSKIVNAIRSNKLGVYEFGKYMLSIEKDKIQIVTPEKIYIKTLLVH